MKTLFLSLCSVLYGLGVSCRNLLFNWRILKTHSFDIPIICIGNITVGGTGKTPHTEGLISVLKDEYRMACLSRGYKRKTSGFVLAGETATADTIGDEPMQIKRKFPEVMVAVDGNRVRAIHKLLKHPEKPDVVIMDDGFQHRYVEADINILLMDYHRPVYEDHLLPWGRLRERPTALERAHYVIVTKCPESITPLEKRLISNNLNLKAYQELLFTTMRYGKITPVWSTGTEDDLPGGSASTILCVSGIADPTPYVKHLETLAGRVIRMDFPDHHAFRRQDLQRMVQTFRDIPTEDKYLFVTEKDAVRLCNITFPEEVACRMFYIPIEVEFLTSKEQLIKNIKDYVRKDKRE